MHLSLEELLAVRDGEAGAEAAAHAASCPACAAEVERLRALRAALAALPPERPARDLWPAVVASRDAARQRRRWARVGWVAAGLAAVFTLAITVRGALEAVHEARLARETQALVAQSQRLERALRGSERRGAVMSGRTAGAVAQLEDRIAVIDGQLQRSSSSRGPSPETVGLWQERVRLLGALVSVEGSGETYVGL